jgi:hypothetical protein
VSQGGEISVGDLVSLLGQVGGDVPAGLAAATGEEDAHGPIKPSRGFSPSSQGRRTPGEVDCLVSDASGLDEE